ncbi:MAG: AAA family ATPase [Peptococcaceae bacterium]|nr:AAA family ATPase [Peptococcaceae bacterium]
MLFKSKKSNKNPVESEEFILWHSRKDIAQKDILEDTLFLHNIPLLPKALPGNGKIIVFQGVAVGDGGTTAALNLAAVLSMASPGMVVIIDLDGYGSVRGRLGLSATDCLVSILDWKNINNQKDIAKGLFSHSSGIMVIPGVVHYDQVDEVNPSLVLKILKTLKENYSYIILDCPPVAINNNTWIAVLVADIIFTVIRPDRDSLDKFPENTSFLARLGCKGRSINILNKAGMPGGIRLADLENNKEFNISEVLPYSINVIENNNRRQLISRHNQRDYYVKSLQALNNRVQSRDGEIIGPRVDIKTG